MRGRMGEEGKRGRGEEVKRIFEKRLEFRNFRQISRS
jgi:hypothetical protein